jgi:hypothetical protein
MTHKIAIIKTKDMYYNYGDDHELIATSITEWTEVSDSDFNILQKARFNRNFDILEQPVSTPEFVAHTVADYIKEAKKAEEKEKEEKQKRDAAALVRKNKKELKTRESRLELLRKLQAELAV